MNLFRCKISPLGAGSPGLAVLPGRPGQQGVKLANFTISVTSFNFGDKTRIFYVKLCIFSNANNVRKATQEPNGVFIGNYF